MKPVLLFPALLLTAPLVLMTQGAEKEDAPQPYTVPEAYQVYDALLPHDWTVTEAHAKLLVIKAETDSHFQICLNPGKDSDPGVGPAVENWKITNTKEWLLQPQFEGARQYVLVPSKHINGFFEPDGGGWKAFYGEYPDSGGFIELSAVGFNKDKTVAVVYMGHSCGGLCGGGTFYVLAKHDGKWGPARYGGGSCAWAS